MFDQYEDESREFSQAPFWFWNDELSEDQIEANRRFGGACKHFQGEGCV